MNILLRTVRLEIKDKAGKVTAFVNYNSEGLRIEFSVNRLPNSNGGGANSAQIQIYNITESTFDFLNDNAVEANLIVGYDEAVNTIFLGNVNTVLRRKNGTDIVTTLYCFTNFLNNKENFINQSYVSVELEDVLLEIANKNNFVLAISDYNKFGGKIVNYTFFSDVWKQLNVLGLKFGFEWYLDNKTLYILPANRNKPNFSINPNTGLIKPPIRTEAGVDVEMFLNPFIKPSDLFELSSKFADFNLAGVEYVQRIKSGGFSDKREVNTKNYIGTYRVLQLIHEGSTHTNSWSTKLIGHRI